ncbi:hypothetical protein JCM6294_1485 [Bacteroides pyogenes DSM 20611 = JCM 6294]|uniref:Uncharacterized protein n=1 Tax=Bacteroides pyogenes DSM 20611 = JCM 6294 TaxID=1121100 RepID=W4PFU6_9BACE|nr:hypothetical protein JCM6294_1485 [Bacteroides pyogenes DSM 20611 = JCM 6294]
MFLFNEIEKIEVSLRSMLVNTVAEETGNIFWMTDSSIFANPAKFNRTMDLIDREFNNSKEDFILHFKNRYTNDYPPHGCLSRYCLWVLSHASMRISSPIP